ncbi:U-box domain-containing protein 1 isoform X2 [Gossypium raimondii]|uniref:U-box domain-containing protein 1 isoform X2 n=1 Tax=Gossypium raimondii TaxID=29730 RepID=UPI002279FCB1|nr:U-box domain-containing protein 1 isoform X2 [Gossypium raimondii]
MGSSIFLQSNSLLESLIHLSNEVSSIEKLPSIQVRNVSTMLRRIKVLTSLFEEIQESNNPMLPPSSVLCLSELFSVIRRVKSTMEGCKNGSSLWGLIQTERLSNQFHVFVKEIARALDILPLSLLTVTVDIKEQIELLHRQAKRVELYVDPKEIQTRDVLLTLMASEKNMFDVETVKHVFNSVGLKTVLDYEEEMSKLEDEVHKQAESEENDVRQVSGSVGKSTSAPFNVPDEFRCPISLDLMKDPVIVASGHTYDRSSIAQWINTGHYTCPKSGQRLIHMALIPNYALKSLVHQWCQENNIPLMECSSNAESEKKTCEKAVDHISATKVAIDSVKRTAEFVVGKLAMGSVDIQRQAAYELRLLAKTGMDNRRIIAEAGAIPFLVTMLSSNDPRTQENAVTALLNLSIFDNNKILIMAAGAIKNIVDVLESGKTMEARENAAAAIFSLSMIDDFKVAIGAHSQAIPALVGLLREGTTTGKRDAAMALCNLALYNANKLKTVAAGAVPLLIELLMDDKAGITDDALGVLALLLSCPQGLEAIKKSRPLVPLLIDLLRFGSAKGKENSITLLLGLCKDGGEEVARRLLINPRSIPSLQSLATDGSPKARRKANALLRLLNRCCSQSHNPIG